MKTSELQGAALDWAVAKCEGVLEDEEAFYINEYTGALMLDRGDDSVAYCPSKLWDHGGPIIERESISIERKHDGWWMASYKYHYADDPMYLVLADTPLIAAMRYYVASKLGEYVDVPF